MLWTILGLVSQYECKYNWFPISDRFYFGKCLPKGNFIKPSLIKVRNLLKHLIKCWSRFQKSPIGKLITLMKTLLCIKSRYITTLPMAVLSKGRLAILVFGMRHLGNWYSSVWNETSKKLEMPDSNFDRVVWQFYWSQYNNIKYETSHLCSNCFINLVVSPSLCIISRASCRYPWYQTYYQQNTSI